VGLVVLDPAVLDALVQAGASAEMIVAAVKADIAKDEARRESKRANNAERQQRFRAKRKSRKGNARNALRDVTPPNDNTLTPGVTPNGETPSGGAAEDFPKPDWCEEDQTWADFLKNRKRKRQPNTPTAYKGFLDDIARIADDEWPPGRLLRHAAAKGWGGIYDPRNTGKPKNDQSPCNDEPHNPYVRAVIRREAERAAAER
jgi:hypothetical protein